MLPLKARRAPNNETSRRLTVLRGGGTGLNARIVYWSAMRRQCAQRFRSIENVLLVHVVKDARCAERRRRDSNPRYFRTTVFKTAALNRSATPPKRGTLHLARQLFPCKGDCVGLGREFSDHRGWRAEQSAPFTSQLGSSRIPYRVAILAECALSRPLAGSSL